MNTKESSTTRLWSGAISGAIACVTCYPLDLIRTRLVVQSSGYYRGIWHGLRRVCAEEGVLGLYKGLGMSLIVCVPSLAISFSVYGTMKQHIEQNYGRSSQFIDPFTGHLNAWGSCLAGAVSGTSASVILFPADVLRRRLQIKGASVHSGFFRSVWYELARILRADGVRGLYRGLLPEVLKVSPMVGIQFTIYESVISILGGLRDHPS